MQKVPTVTDADVDGAAAAAGCIVETHRRLAEWLREGQTLAQVDRFIATTLDDLACRSCFLGYRAPGHPPFPSHACLSVNDCVVHGTAAAYLDRLREGDVLSVDIGVLHKGWIGDAAWTYAIKSRSDETARLMDCGIESIRRGVPTLKPGNRYVEWAKAVQTYVEGECGFFLVRGLGGHGYGRQLHAPPFVSNVVPAFGRGHLEWPEGQKEIEPGTLLAVEPMLAVSTGDTVQEGRRWPIHTADGSLSVHYEHDVLVTEDGPRVLTEGLYELPDVVG